MILDVISDEREEESKLKQIETLPVVSTRSHIIPVVQFVVIRTELLEALDSMRQIIITLKINLTENRGAIVSLQLQRDKWVITLRPWIREDKPFSSCMRGTL